MSTPHHQRDFDPDEIPGYSTYIQKEHRFRHPHELVNSWKHENHVSELEENLGITNMAREELVELLEAVQLERRDSLNKVQDLIVEVEHREVKVKKTEKKIEAIEITLARDTQKMKEAASILDETRRQFVKTRADLVKFGGHMVGCEYLEATYSGRRLSTQAEENLCSCGWVGLQKKI